MLMAFFATIYVRFGTYLLRLRRRSLVFLLVEQSFIQLLFFSQLLLCHIILEVVCCDRHGMAVGSSCFNSNSIARRNVTFSIIWVCIKKQKNLQQQVSSKQFFFCWDLFSKFKRFDKNEYNGEFLLHWRFQKTTWIRSLISNLQQILGTSKLRSLFGTSKIRWWR